MDNENIIRQRLLSGTSTTRGEPPLKKLLLALKSLSNSSGVQWEKQYKQLCSETCNVEFLAQRHAAMQHACRREVQRYDEKRAKIQASIAAAEQEIEAAKKALQEAQIVRQHEEECEVKKHDIMKHMGRPATAKEAEKVNAEVLSIQADSAQADALLALRRKQFATLLHSLETLQAAISDDSASMEGIITT